MPAHDARDAGPRAITDIGAVMMLIHKVWKEPGRALYYELDPQTIAGVVSAKLAAHGFFTDPRTLQGSF